MSREADLYKDKIEVSLDGRQIFYLFFGGAVIVGLVFVLGVMVGRRVEARGHVDRAHTEASTDPLAALDRLEGSGSGGLSFQKALLAPAPAVPVAEPVDKKIDKLADAKKAEIAAAEAKPAKPEPKAEAKPEPKEAKEPAKKDDAPKVRYTLQLSSFQDKGEAQAFLDDIKGAGFEAYMIEAAVEGKGTFYRVRLGSYRSMDAANDAKSEFEKAAKKNAYVMRL